MLFNRFPHALGERYRRIEHRSRKEEQELLATVSSDPVDLARLVLEDLRELAQHGVASLMAIRVVHDLELVDIAHHA